MPLDLAAVLRLSRDLQIATKLGRVVQAAQDAVRATAGYTTTWLSAAQPGTPRTARVLAVRGAIEELVWDLAPTFQVEGDAMLEEVWDATRPVVVVDARSDPRTNKREVEVFGNLTLIHVPLMLGSERVGALSTGTFGPEGIRPPTDEQLEALVVVATLVAAALLRVRVQEALNESEQTIRRLTEGSLRSFEEERLRISRELHDGVGQMLIAAQLQLSDLMHAALPGWSGKVERTQHTIGEAISHIRSLSHDLRPASLDALGLPEALRELAKSCTTNEFQVQIELKVPPGAPVPPGEMAISLYRVAQIALANTVRHAGAAQATIALEISAVRVRLEIADRGIGFDLTRARASQGIGLIGIRERAKGLNGSCQIVSAPGAGTCVVVEVPFGLN